jgi:amidase
MQTTTEPLAWGPTRNPWRLDRSAGGSSGGAAAAVAAELTPVAHATDGGGSARIPAGACGVVGLKPSRGRVSTGPWIRFADDLFGNVHEGLLTRTVRDLASMLDVVFGRRPGDSWSAPSPARPYAEEVGADPGALRIGVLAHDPSGAAAVDPQVRAAVEAVAEALATLGHDLREEHPAVLAQGGIPAEFAPCFPLVVAHELAAYGRRIGRPLTEDDVEPGTWALAQGGAQVSGAQLATGVDALRRRGAEVRAWWEADGWDLLLTPTAAAMPPAIGEVARLEREGGAAELVAAATAFTVAFNVSGQPAVSLPLGTSGDGLPIGIQLVAAYGREDLLIRVAAQLERALPWAGRRPALLEEVAA